MAGNLMDAIERAREVADKQPEAYRTVVFEVTLKHFLGVSDGADSPPRLSPPASTITMELNEFLASKKAESHPDRLVAIAYYYYRRSGDSITTKDVADAYGKVRLKKPQNIHDVLSTCIRRGILVDTEKKDGMRAWLITPSGESYVERELSGSGGS